MELQSKFLGWEQHSGVKEGDGYFYVFKDVVANREGFGTGGIRSVFDTATSPESGPRDHADRAEVEDSKPPGGPVAALRRGSAVDASSTPAPGWEKGRRKSANGAAELASELLGSSLQSAKQDFMKKAWPDAAPTAPPSPPPDAARSPPSQPKPGGLRLVSVDDGPAQLGGLDTGRGR